MIPYSMGKRLITITVIGMEENEYITLVYTLRNVKNANGWLIYSIVTT